MDQDPRCCGSGTCIIDTEGRCWCGQQWDGEKMASCSLVSPVTFAQAGQAAPDPAPDPDRLAHP